VLAKGTPVAQCVSVKREVWSSRFEVISEEAAVQINEGLRACDQLLLLLSRGQGPAGEPAERLVAANAGR
jgi:hypothetical protein